MLYNKARKKSSATNRVAVSDSCNTIGFILHHRIDRLAYSRSLSHCPKRMDFNRGLSKQGKNSAVLPNSYSRNTAGCTPGSFRKSTVGWRSGQKSSQARRTLTAQCQILTD